MPIGIIDYDRGVIINVHKTSGMDVFMYVDDPGKFITAHGNIVPDEIAKEAGYDVEKLAKDRTKKERKEQAMQMIDAELADDKDVKEEVVTERNGYKIITTGLGRHHLIDPDGNRLTSVPQPLEAAEKLLNGMAGKEEKVVSTKK
jgi:hypothetical protein